MKQGESARRGPEKLYAFGNFMASNSSLQPHMVLEVLIDCEYIKAFLLVKKWILYIYKNDIQEIVIIFVILFF